MKLFHHATPIERVKKLSMREVIQERSSALIITRERDSDIR